MIVFQLFQKKLKEQSSCDQEINLNAEYGEISNICETNESLQQIGFNFTEFSITENSVPHNEPSIVTDQTSNYTLFNDESMDFESESSEMPEIDVNNFRTIHPNLSCSVRDAMTLIYAFSHRHNLNWQGVEDLLLLVNTIVKTNELVPSKYLFKKMFMQNDNTKPQAHFWCQNCGKYFGSKDSSNVQSKMPCENCKTDVSTDTKYKKNHFMVLPIKNQLKNILEQNSEFVEFNKPSLDDVITDVHDAANFQKLKQKEENNCSYITITFSCDGAAVFKATKNKSMWPLQFFINEIDLNHRFKRQNMIVAAVSFGETPNMQIYFKPFIDEIKMINSEGGITFIDKNRQNRTVKIFPMLFSADALAKAYVLNRIQHNGRQGCPYCLHNGINIEGSTQIRYCKEGNTRLRTNEEIRSNMIQAHKTLAVVNGFKGLSPLVAFNHFDIASQVVIDKMHCTDMGVINKMFDLFLNNKFRGKRYQSISLFP